jgi:transposase InsO family protein
MISDQGREFINSVNAELQQQLGTEHRISSAYHPQTNGLVEKLNSTVH